VSEDEPQPADDTEPTTSRPLLRVITGNPTAEELAALVTVVAALGAGSGAPPRRRTPEWSAHHRKVRTSLPHGSGGWRSSALPR
jgi:hypothetical protein